MVEYGASPGAAPTDRLFTGQRYDSDLGLYDYKARWYDPWLGRFIQPDPIVPDPANPQALNRYSYCLNDPINHTDPSGFDPLDAEWEAAFRAAHKHDPTDQDRRDRLFSVIHLGSRENGDWDDNDWAAYASDKVAYWEGKDWPGDLPAGLNRFATHVERLASYYKAGETSLFVKAVAFVWGGVPYVAPLSASVTMAVNPGSAWEQYPPLQEGTAGWNPSLVDDENPSHHYAGFLHAGYFLSYLPGAVVNYLRDGLMGYNPQDLRCGNIAARHGDMLFDHHFTMYDLGYVIRGALSVSPSIWPLR